MAANIKEDDIIESIYESNKSWVSVEVKIDRELTPDELFNLTESQAGDRFYFRLNDNTSSFFGYHAVQRLKITLIISNRFFVSGKNLKRY